MSFHDNIEADAIAQRKGVRKVDRDSLFMAGRLHLDDTGETIDVRIRNLSAGGLMAEPNVNVTNGQNVRVELRNIGLVEGRVAWANDRQFGVAFASPIDPKVVRRPVGSGESEKPISLRKVANYARPGVTSR